MIGATLRKILQNNPKHDYNHANDPLYKKLRDQADQYRIKGQKLCQQSRHERKQGNITAARALSEQAKGLQMLSKKYNMKAAEYVFVENNTDSSADEIDLHGLTVKEAKWISKKRIAADIQNGKAELKVIVGKGLHSKNGVGKIKLAVRKLCKQAGLKCYIDPKNVGVLVIDMKGARVPISWATELYNSQVTEHEQADQGYVHQSHPQYYSHQQGFQEHTHFQQQDQQQQQGMIVAILKNLLCKCIFQLA